MPLPNVLIQAGLEQAEPIGPNGADRYRAFESHGGASVFVKRARDRRAGLVEARILNRLSEPFVPRLLQLVRDEDAYWLVQSWVDGTHLADARELPATWPVDLLRCLVHLHRSGVVHGDLKPQNVLLRNDMAVSIIDFDFASRQGDEPSFDETGGTPGYVAPERLTGWPADPRSDLYSYAKVVDRFGCDSAELMHALRSCTAETPGARPSSADALMPVATECLGAGAVPPPALDFAGWRRAHVDAVRLGDGLARYLGVDALGADRLARSLLFVSGGSRALAARVWKDWLPTFVDDPWGRPLRELSRATVESLRDHGSRVARELVDELPETARSSCVLAAQCGRQVHEDEYRELCDVVGAGTAEAEWETLHGSGVVSGDDPATFLSVPVWRTCFDRIEEGPRRAAHERLASRRDASCRETAPELYRVGWHHAQAGTSAAASDAFVRAARHAIERVDSAWIVRALDAAFRCFEGDTARLQPEPPTPESPFVPSASTVLALGRDALPLLEEYTLALTLMKQLEAAEQCVALHRSHAASHQREAWSELLAAEIAGVGRRDSSRGLEYSVRGLRLLDERPHTEVRARLLLNRGRGHIGLQQLDQAESVGRSAVAALIRESAHRYVPAAEATLGRVSLVRGDRRRARARLAFARDVAERHGSQLARAVTMSNLAAIDFTDGAIEQAVTQWERVAELALAAETTGLYLTSIENLVMADIALGTIDRALRRLDRSVQHAREVQMPWAYMRAVRRIAECHVHRGTIPIAFRWVEQGLTIPGKQGEVDVERMRLLIAGVWARVLWASVPADDSWISRLRDLIARAEGEVKRSGEVALALHELQSGRAPLGVIESLGEPPADPHVAGSLCLVRALAYESNGNRARALNELESAILALEDRPAERFNFATVLLHKGRLLTASGSNDAIAIATDTVRIARAIGARRLEAEALLLRRRCAPRK